MKIKLNKETQNFLGEYCSKVSTDQQSHKGTITGHLLGDLIVFMVRWDSAAITAWVGQVKKRLIKTEEDNGKKEEHKITTLWMMTSKSNGWTPINAGADTFVKTPAFAWGIYYFVYSETCSILKKLIFRFPAEYLIINYNVNISGSHI